MASRAVRMPIPLAAPLPARLQGRLPPSAPTSPADEWESNSLSPRVPSSYRSRRLLWLAEHHEVLLREVFDRLDVLESHRRHLLFGLGLGHLVVRVDRHLWVLGPVFEVDHSPAGFQRLHDRLH